MDRREMLKQIPAAMAALGLGGEANADEKKSIELMNDILRPVKPGDPLSSSAQRHNLINEMLKWWLEFRQDGEVPTNNGKFEQDVLRNQQEAIRILREISESCSPRIG